MRLVDEFDAELFYLVLSNQEATRNPADRRIEVLKAVIRLGMGFSELDTLAHRSSFTHYERRWRLSEQIIRRYREEILNHSIPDYGKWAATKCVASRIILDGFIITEFPHSWRSIQQRFLEVRQAIRPNLVLLPSRDAHQDHIIVHDAANREFRKGADKWYYEIPQFDDTPFIPNLFVQADSKTAWAHEEDISDDDDFKGSANPQIGKLIDHRRLGLSSNPQHITEYGRTYRISYKEGSYAERKVDLLAECFRTQNSRAYFHPNLVLGMMASRGMQSGLESHFAEAFRARLSI
jgi:LmbE family N-acetylglucosaminyl deacetylase